MEPGLNEPSSGPTFGSREQGSYRVRIGAYGVCLRDGRVLVVDAPEGRFLPGGALDAGETEAQALAREVTEETGYGVLAARPLGQASQLIVMRASGERVEKRGLFFRVDLSDQPRRSPTETDHEAQWLPFSDALATLTDESHAWAVRQAMREPHAEPD